MLRRAAIFTFATALFFILGPVLFAAVPVLTSMSPTSATAGGSGFTLTVTGSSFVSGSVVRWNGSSRTTTFVSSTSLTAAITSSDIASAGTAAVTVFTSGGSGGTSAALTFTINPPVPVPASSHVFLVVLENGSFGSVTNSADIFAYMPWLITQGNANGYTANYTSDNAGSLLAYLWLSSGSCEGSACTLPPGGSNFGCTGGSCTSIITDDNIYREMISSGISWKLYAESLPFVGYAGVYNDAYNKYAPYDSHHNGPQWYSDVYNTQAQRNNMVPFTQFPTDLAANQLPQYSIIVANDNDENHDGNAAHADAWLQTNLASLLSQPYFQCGGDGLMIVTFDNDDYDQSGLIYTAVIGPNVTPHTVSSTAYKHENALRTILDALGITTRPGWSATASPMSDFFSASPPCGKKRKGQLVSD